MATDSRCLYIVARKAPPRKTNMYSVRRLKKKPTKHIYKICVPTSSWHVGNVKHQNALCSLMVSLRTTGQESAHLMELKCGRDKGWGKQSPVVLQLPWTGAMRTGAHTKPRREHQCTMLQSPKPGSQPPKASPSPSKRQSSTIQREHPMARADHHGP